MLEAKSKDAFITKRGANLLKGIFALMVVLSHIHGRISLFSTSFIGTILSPFGYLAVAGFFFLSGYGLYEAYCAKEKYMQGFFRTKILPFYLVCLFMIVFYTLRDLVFDYPFSPKAFFLSPFLGATVVDFGWYLQVQTLIYLIFFLVFRFAPKYKVLLVSLALVLFSAIAILAGLEDTWYLCVLAFPLGLLVAKEKSRVIRFLGGRGKTLIVFLAFFALFLFALFFGNKDVLPIPLRIAVKMVSALSFSLAAAIFLHLLPLVLRPIEALGKRSLEIYIMQGFVLKVLLELALPNEYLYILLSVVGILLLAFAAHTPVRKFYSLFQIRKKTEG